MHRGFFVHLSLSLVGDDASASRSYGLFAAYGFTVKESST